MLNSYVLMAMAEIVFGIASIYAKKGTVLPYGAYLFWTNVVFAILLIPSLFIFNITMIGGVYGALIGIDYALANYTFYKALSIEKTFVVSSLASVSSIVGYLLGVGILNEPFSLIKFLGVGLAVVGAAAVSIEDLAELKKIKTVKPIVVLLALLNAVFWGISFILIKLATDNMPIFPILWIKCVVGVIIGLAWVFITKQHLDLDNAKFPLTSGTARNIGHVFLFLAIASMNASIAAGMASLYILVVFIYDSMVEKHNIALYRLVGALLIVLGTMVVVG